jgi:hypothetical protein
MRHKKPEFVKVYKEYSTETVKFFSYIDTLTLPKEKDTDAEPRPEYKKEPKPRTSTRP